MPRSRLRQTNSSVLNLPASSSAKEVNLIFAVKELKERYESRETCQDDLMNDLDQLAVARNETDMMWEV